MIDDDDFASFALLATSPRTFFGALVLLALLVCLMVAAYSNGDECAMRSCTTGKPMVVKHECVCITTAR